MNSLRGIKMFNLLVKYQPWGNGRDRIPHGRALEYTEQSLIDQFMPGGALDLDGLATLPTMFVQETSGQPDQVARLGTITRARIDGRDIVLDYTYDLGVPSVPNVILQRCATDLEIKDFEFSRTHWSVKNADLYRALVKSLPPRRQQTKVFQLAEFENVEPSLVSAMMPFDSHFDAVYAALRR
jgi:hypothetical protein